MNNVEWVYFNLSDMFPEGAETLGELRDKLLLHHADIIVLWGRNIQVCLCRRRMRCPMLSEGGELRLASGWI